MRIERFLAQRRWRCYAESQLPGCQQIGPWRPQKVKAMPQILPQHTIVQPTVFRIPPPGLCLFILLAILSIWPALTLAEVRVVTAQGEHRMGDRDTREEAVRLATEAAKRDALEQVAVYLESITIVDGLDVTKDEIRTYTAGLVLVLEQKTNTTLDENTVVIRTDLVAQIDTEEVRQAIAALREDEDARRQLVELQQENDQLQQDLDAANQALAQASTTEQTQLAARQRQDILNRVQSNAMVSQAWTDWALVSPAVYSSSLVGLAQIQALLNVAQGLYPTSQHVLVAQQVISTRQPAAPPQPPFPPVPGMRHPTMPRHLITPAPGSPTVVPRTLNEFTYRTPTAPHHIDNQPGGIHRTPPSTESKTLTDARQVNPFLPPPSATPPGSQQTPALGSRSARALQQFLQPSQAAAGVPPAGQPSMARPLPPTMNQIHPSNLQHAPHLPNQLAPRGVGGGGHGGAGGQSHGGGGSGHGGSGGRGR